MQSWFIPQKKDAGIVPSLDFSGKHAQFDNKTFFSPCHPQFAMPVFFQNIEDSSRKKSKDHLLVGPFFDGWELPKSGIPT